MKIPFSVIELDAVTLDVWNKIYVPSRGTSDDKTIEESLWRRTQDSRNSKQSGWKNSSDKRRKVLYYKHRYDLFRSNSVSPYVGLAETYVYGCLTLPHDECKEYQSMFHVGFANGGWEKITDTRYKRGDLNLEVLFYERPKDNLLEYDMFPDNYSSYEFSLWSDSFLITEELKKIPWSVLQTGMRKSRKRANPKYVKNIADIIDSFPVQMNLGCGPSYEAGIPALHELHEIYSINEPFSKKFIIKADEDRFIRELILNPVKTYKRTSDIFAKIISAPLTDFYRILAKLHEHHLVVGPIITNNFDGLHLRLGLSEIFVRKYEENFIAPLIDFDERAKTLLVVGSHADRRNIEELARTKGLRVVYIDPEGWWSDGSFHSYPLESPQDEDLIYKKGASETFVELFEELVNRRIINNYHE